MKKLIISGVLIVAMLLVPLAHANSTLFFDDFVTSEFPIQWTSLSTPFTGLGNSVSESGGYVSLNALRDNLSPGQTYSIEGMIANASLSNAIVGPNTPDGQFIFMSWRMFPLNMTTPSTTPNGNVLRTAEVMFGLSSAPPTNFYNAGSSLITFDLWLSDKPGGFGDLGAAKSAIFLNVLQETAGFGGPTNCFITPGSMFGSIVTCPYHSMQYSNPSGPLDLNGEHVFTIEMNLRPAAHKSLIRFNVDGMGWNNYTQTACSCIDPPGGAFLNAMYPFIEVGYSAIDHVGTGGCCVTMGHLPSQSIATQLDWVLVSDYVPASLPAGQLLSSGANPPLTNPQPYTPGGGTLTQYFQYIANSWSPGNIYAGGMLMIGVLAGITFVFMGMAALKVNASLRSFGFIYNFMVLGFSYMGYYAQIVPLWLPVMLTILAACITFGVVQSTTRGDSGGTVPD